MSYNKDTGFYEGYIYCITNILDNKKYIGQTSTTIDHRWGQHKPNIGKLNRPLYNAMNKYGVDNFKIEQIMKVIASSIEELVNKLNTEEIFCIKWYKSLCEEHGYNIDEGGASASYYREPVDAYTLDGQYIRSFDSEREAERYYGISGVANMCKGIQNKNSKYNITFRYSGEPFDKYNPNKFKRSSDYYQFSLNGELLNKFDNRALAQEYLREKYGIKYATCIDVAIKNNTTAYGFVWSNDGVFRFDKNNYRNCISIDLYTIDGKFLGSFDTITSGLYFIKRDNKAVSSVLSVINGKRPQAYGYVWRKKGEPFDKYPINNIRIQREIDLYSVNGKFIGTYKNKAEGLKSIGYTNAYVSHVTLCCEGKRPVSLGYVWRYKGHPFNEFSTKPKETEGNKKKANQYTIDDKFVYTHNSFQEAADKLNYKNAGPMISCARGKRKTAAGYKWYYANDPNQPDKSRIIN